MSFNYLKQSWETLARTDAMWAVLSDDEKKGGRWNPAEFFETGRKDVHNILERLDHWKIPVHRGRALDFGCGLGRLTNALASHFKSADGVDISSEMISRATELHRASTNLRFIHNPHRDLSQLADNSYDFLVSLITLQHMPERISLGYLREFPRILSSGGVAYFQVSSFPDAANPAGRAKLQRDRDLTTPLYRAVRKMVAPRPPRMESHYCRLSRICSLLEQANTRIIAVLPDEAFVGPLVSHVVIFRKP